MQPREAGNSAHHTRPFVGRHRGLASGIDAFAASPRIAEVTAMALSPCALLFRPEIESLRAAGERVLAEPDADPARGMSRLIAQYRFGERWQHRDLDREIASLNWSYAEVFKGLRERSDELVCSQIEELVRHYVRLGRMSRAVQPQDVSCILYAVHTYHRQEWALRDDISLEQTRRDLRRHVMTAFRAWSTASS
jgi:hypothetical protein